jgi:hypothetical protein
MAFQPGNKLSTGRPAGSKNKRTLELEALADKHECNPFEVLLLFAKGDWEALGYDSSVIVKEKADGSGSTFMEYTISPELRAKCAEKACEYLFPKRKSVEHVQNNMLEGMTPQEKLEAMKQAVRMLEGQLDE